MRHLWTLTLALLATTGCAATAPARGDAAPTPARVAASVSPSTPDAPASAPAGPALILTDMDGTTHDVGALIAGGENVVLVFWQVWCHSCRKEAPAIVAAAQAQAGHLRFFGVVSGPDDVVDDADVRATATKWGLTYPQVRDRDAGLAQRFGVRGTPTVIVLGPGSDPHYSGHHAPADWTAVRGPGHE